MSKQASNVAAEPRFEAFERFISKSEALATLEALDISFASPFAKRVREQLHCTRKDSRIVEALMRDEVPDLWRIDDHHFETLASLCAETLEFLRRVAEEMDGPAECCDQPPKFGAWILNAQRGEAIA